MYQLLLEDETTKESVTPQPITGSFTVIGDNIIPAFSNESPLLRIGDLYVLKNSFGSLAIKITRNDSLGIKIKPVFINDTRTNEHPFPRILTKKDSIEMQDDDYILAIADSRDGIIPPIFIDIRGVEILRFLIKADTVGATPATIDFARFVREK